MFNKPIVITIKKQGRDWKDGGSGEGGGVEGERWKTYKIFGRFGFRLFGGSIGWDYLCNYQTVCLKESQKVTTQNGGYDTKNKADDTVQP